MVGQTQLLGQIRPASGAQRANSSLGSQRIDAEDPQAETELGKRRALQAGRRRVGGVLSGARIRSRALQLGCSSCPGTGGLHQLPAPNRPHSWQVNKKVGGTVPRTQTHPALEPLRYSTEQKFLGKASFIILAGT